MGSRHVEKKKSKQKDGRLKEEAEWISNVWRERKKCGEGARRLRDIADVHNKDLY